MVRNLVVLLVGALIGAALFHAYYLRLPAQTQCAWDHPLDGGARRACVLARQIGYPAGARAALDDLVGRISH